MNTFGQLTLEDAHILVLCTINELEFITKRHPNYGHIIKSLAEILRENLQDFPELVMTARTYYSRAFSEKHAHDFINLHVLLIPLSAIDPDVSCTDKW